MGVDDGGWSADAERAEDLFDGEQAAEVDELEQAEFEVEALFLAVAQLVEGAEHGLEEAGELFLAEEGGGAGGAALLVGGDLQELGGVAVAVGGEAGDLGDERSCGGSGRPGGRAARGSCRRRAARWRWS